MRLFTGIEIPGPILDNLDRLIARLRPTARIRWSPAKNIHVTTKFIGEWPPVRLGELEDALRTIPAPGSIPIAIRNLGWFPNERGPRVFWAGIEAGDGLFELARATEECCARLGVERERRRYSPHLTLARIKEPLDLGPLRRMIEGLDPAEFGSFTASHFFLYESALDPAGSVYAKRAAFALERT